VTFIYMLARYLNYLFYSPSSPLLLLRTISTSFIVLFSYSIQSTSTILSLLHPLPLLSSLTGTLPPNRMCFTFLFFIFKLCIDCVRVFHRCIFHTLVRLTLLFFLITLVSYYSTAYSAFHYTQI
jgi:hypothetical protein